eukprot:4197627-Pyramimonas_sp.AAC.3
MALTKVDLPEATRPTTATISPGRASKFTSCRRKASSSLAPSPEYLPTPRARAIGFNNDLIGSFAIVSGRTSRAHRASLTLRPFRGGSDISLSYHVHHNEVLQGGGRLLGMRYAFAVSFAGSRLLTQTPMDSIGYFPNLPVDSIGSSPKLPVDSVGYSPKLPVRDGHSA